MFAPEIMTFAPPPAPAPKEALSTPSPQWRRSPVVSEKTPPPMNMASTLNGSVEQEASVLRPVSLRQRGPTLSILGSRRKDSDPARPAEPLNGIAEHPAHRRSASSKDDSRRSILRNPSSDVGSPVLNGGTDWGTSLGLRKSTDRPRVSEVSASAGQQPQQQGQEQVGVGKRGSVRKRLSMLRIGGGAKKTSNMGSLDEE
jgi:hypothetical protein